jgi:hypothetical protein
MIANATTAPDVPCDDCMTDPRARAETPVGVSVYCGHNAALSIRDARFGTWITYAPIGVHDAAATVAAAIADRAARDAAADTPPCLNS